MGAGICGSAEPGTGDARWRQWSGKRRGLGQRRAASAGRNANGGGSRGSFPRLARLPQLPDSDFAKTKRQLQKPEMLNYLDRVQQKIAVLPFPEEVKQAAVRQEGLRRRPEALQGENVQAAARRGIMLMCAVVLSKAGPTGQEVVAAAPDTFRQAYRANRFVETSNTVPRIQQA